jgi:hypothetical protein
MQAPPLVHEPETSLCDPEIVICGDGLNPSRTEYAVWLDHIHSAPLHIITVSSIGREFSTASLLLNWRREMELMAIMNHLSCLFSAFPLNYSARRTLLAQYGYTNTALCTTTHTRPCVKLYNYGPVYIMHTWPCVVLYKHSPVHHYAHTALCTLCTRPCITLYKHGPVQSMHTRPCVVLYKHSPVHHYAHTVLCTLCTHGPVRTMHTRPCAHYAHTALCTLCTRGTV